MICVGLWTVRDALPLVRDAGEQRQDAELAETTLTQRDAETANAIATRELRESKPVPFLRHSALQSLCDTLRPAVVSARPDRASSLSNGTIAIPHYARNDTGCSERQTGRLVRRPVVIPELDVPQSCSGISCTIAVPAAAGACSCASCRSR